MITVIGDYIQDKYYDVEINRISPEAPCLIGDSNKKSYDRDGGAGNVYNNIKTLIDNNKFMNKESIEYHYTSFSRKTRFIDNNFKHQLFRFDEDNKKVKLESNCKWLNNNINTLVISDYNKNNNTLRKYIDKYLQSVNSCIVFINSKRTFIDCFHRLGNVNQAWLFVNEYEFKQLYFNRLIGQRNTKFEFVIETKGSKGMIIHQYDINEGQEINTRVVFTDPIQFIDVTGAGDTIFSVFSYCISYLYHNKTLLNNHQIVDIAKIANKAAGQVIQVQGTTILDSEYISKDIKNNIFAI